MGLLALAVLHSLEPPVAARMTKDLMRSIGYTFKDTSLLEDALTHTSFLNKMPPDRFEKLEFLGDRVLALVMADMLYHLDANYSEADMSIRMNYLVCRDTCASVAQACNLQAYLRVGPSERKSALQKVILADACEALMGAVYLDSSFNVAKVCIQNMWAPHLERDHIESIAQDPKTLLQQWAQKKGLALPAYTVTKCVGRAHEPVFTVLVTVGGHHMHAEGGSKKEAERRGAELLLTQLPRDK